MRTYVIAALLISILLVLLSLLRRNRCSQSAINLDDLLIGEDGKLSKAAAVLMGSFLVTTWIMVDLALADKMTEGYLTVYGGFWIIPTVTKLIKGQKESA